MEIEIVDRDLLIFHVVISPKLTSSSKNKPAFWHAFHVSELRFFEGGVCNFLL